MEDLKYLLESLEDDGKVYAHFLTHPQYPGYYGILVRERTPEYMFHWMPESALKDYRLAFSIEMFDNEFCDYMAELFPEQIKVPFLKLMFKIDDVSRPELWSDGFKTWRQEKIRLNRTKWLEQYPWVLNTNKKYSGL